MFGIYHSLQTAGLLTAAAVFSLFVRENYPLSGLLTVLSYGTAAALSLALIEVAPEGERRSGAKGFREALSETFGSRQLLKFLIGSALLNETHQTVTVFLNQLQYEVCGLGNAAMGYIYIAATVLGMCGVWSARFTKRAGIPASAAILCAASAVSCLVLAGTKRALPSVCGILMLRVSNSLFLPFQTIIQAMLLDSIGAGTNLAFGALAERHLAGAFLFGAGICAGGAALLLKSSRNLGEKQAKS